VPNIVHRSFQVDFSSTAFLIPTIAKAKFEMSAIVSESPLIKHVLIVIAMEAEAAPLLEKLKLSIIPSTAKNSPCLLYSGSYKGCTVSVVTNGKCSKFGVDNVGTVPAALTTFLAINQLSPDLVINAGTAGGFKKKGAAIGDAFICTHMMNHDRRIPIPGFTEYGTGSYSAFPTPNIVEVRLQSCCD
jgi:5'-methylthioadenosine nucleosidase